MAMKSKQANMPFRQVTAISKDGKAKAGERFSHLRLQPLQPQLQAEYGCPHFTG